MADQEMGRNLPNKKSIAYTHFISRNFACNHFPLLLSQYYSRVSNIRTASIKRTQFHMACKEGQFDVVKLIVNDLFKTFSIILNAQHVNGMTPFDVLYQF